MPILGLSERRRMPRAGKIRLGVMVQPAGARRPYPRATDHFVCPPNVQRVFGEEPKSLSIIFPSDDPDAIFPQAYQYYKSSGLFCRGDGVKALRWKGSELAEVACPCAFLESGDECKPLATLNFFLPDVGGLGVWQLSTSNKASIVSINSGLEEFRAMFGGLRGIPFTLLLEPQKVQRYDEAKRAHVQTTLYVLRLDSEFTLRQIVAWREKAGKAVEALMPAPETDEHEVAVLTAQEGEAVPEANGAEPEAPASPAGRSEPEGDPPLTFLPPERPPDGGDTLTIDRPPALAQPAAPEPGELADIADVSLCYRWAAECGVSADLYERYFETVHGVRTGDAPDALVAREAAEFRAALASESQRLTHKSVLIRRLNDALKAKGARR